MRRLLLSLTCLLLVSTTAWAGSPWYFPTDTHRSYVNPHLTPTRALKGAWQSRFDGQLVLWQGKASKVRRNQPQSLLLATDSGKSVEVHFSRTVKNLQVDREGEVLAIKGHVRRTPAGKVFLEGRSVIPWRPGKGFTRNAPMIEQWIGFSRPELPEATRVKIAELNRREAASQNLDPLFLTALIQVESGFDPRAVSVSGALGLGQLMPDTARGLGVDPHNMGDNIRGCARMISGLVQRYQHRADGKALALASYNAGPTLVAQTLRVPPYEQTVNYVYFIGSLHQELQRQQRALR